MNGNMNLKVSEQCAIAAFLQFVNDWDDWTI